MAVIHYKNRNLVPAAIFAVALAGPVSAEGVDLAALQDWNIVQAADAIPSEIYAAEEFQNFYAQASGVTLPIVRSTDRPDRHIFINSADMGEEAFQIVIGDNRIVISGGRPRGVLYGVYQFLEDYLGVRFLAADHTHVPSVGKSRKAGPLDRSYHPPVLARFVRYGENKKNPAFATRMRINTITDDLKLGGRTGFRNINHSFFLMLPTKKYGKDHPEYYCLVDGKRRWNAYLLNVSDAGRYGNEPCLTNPDVLKIVTEEVLAYLKDHPGAANVSVSQNDNTLYCRCPRCAAIDEREGTPMGSILTFVNAVADEVAGKYPNVKVGTLAYSYSRRPPKTIRPKPNVQIQLASIECCVLHPINDPNCPKNVAFCRDLESWGGICDMITVWNYNTNFYNYLLSFPNLRVIEPNIRFLVKNNVKGFYMQAAGNAEGAEFSDLRNYMISNLLWDPSKNGRKLMDEFMDLHYGPAGPPIRRFINLVHDNAEKKGIHRNCYGTAADYGIDETIAQAGLDAFAEALQLAGNDVILRRRVEKASVCAYRAAIEPVWNIVWNLDAKGKYRPEEPAEKLAPEMIRKYRPLVKRFLELCRKHGVTRAAENADYTMPLVEERLRKAFGL